MAIHWHTGPKAGTAEFTGAVLEVGYQTVKIMSDVWEDRLFVDVWDGTKVCSVDLTQPATAERDATEEVRLQVERWHDINVLIKQSRRHLREAAEPSLSKEVEVTGGRKVPWGGGYEAVRLLRSEYGYYLHIRDRAGKVHSVNPRHVCVVDPTRYAIGPVACQDCRREFGSALEAGMVASLSANPVCRACRRTGAVAGKYAVALPSGSKEPAYSPFDTAHPATDPLEVSLIETVFDNPSGKVNWFAWADYLMEHDDPRGQALYEALEGTVKVKPKPIRLKDLKVTPWRRVDGTFSVWECVISGFPPQDDGRITEVVARMNAGTKASVNFHGRTSSEVRGYIGMVKGALLRQVRKILPPLSTNDNSRQES